MLRMLLSIIIGAAFCLGLFSSPSHAQRHHLRAYTESDGMRSSAVRAVVQDRRGYIWVASRTGLTRFDGASWDHFDTEHGLERTEQSHLLIGSDGHALSVSASPYHSVWKFDGQSWFEVVPNLNQDFVVTRAAIVKRPNDDCIVLGGLGGLAIARNGAWTIIDIPGENTHVFGVEAVENNCVINTSAGLFLLDLDSQRLQPFTKVPHGKILSVHYSSSISRLWVITPAGIGAIDEPLKSDAHWQLLSMNPSLPLRQGQLISQADKSGGLYIAGMLQLVYFHPETGLEFFNRQDGLLSEGATDLFFDSEGILWIASARALTKLISRRYTTFTSDEGLLKDEVSAIERLPDGQFLLGHDGGLTVFGNSPRTIELGEDGTPRRVMDIETGPDGRIWIAASKLGYGVLQDDRVAWSPDSGKNVWALKFASDGTLWTGGAEGLFNHTSSGVVKIEHPELFNVRRLTETSDNSLYAPTGERGLFRVRNGQLTQITNSVRSSLTSTYCVLECSTGELWIGTAGGLARIVNGSIEQVEVPHVDRPIYTMSESNEGIIWFGTDNGVLRWDGERLVHQAVEHGLGGRDVNRDALFLKSNGDAYIGTDGGLSFYDKSRDPENIPPKVEILAINADGQSFPGTFESFEIQRGGTIGIDFFARSFINEERVRFQTFLEGYDEEWSEPREIPSRKVQFARLPPGDYRFHIRAIDINGMVSPDVVTSSWSVLQVAWLRPWAMVLQLVALAIVIAIFAGFIVQWRYAIRLEGEVQVRTEELRLSQIDRSRADRLEALGVLAGGIAHDFNNILTGILGNLSLLERQSDLSNEARVLTSSSTEAANRARALTMQLLTFAKGGAPVRKAAAIEDVLRESASFVLSGSSVKLEFEIAGNLRPTEVDVGQMSQVINNLLLNAREATETQGNVWIRARNVYGAPSLLPKAWYVEIEVEDDGRGISPDVIDRVFDPYFTTKDNGTGLGLASSYSIIERHAGQLSVESKSGKGTLVRIFLPCSNDILETKPIPTQLLRNTRKTKGRVLVVDDEASVLLVFERMLESLGYPCVTASDGSEAISTYESAMNTADRIEVVIMDLTIRGGLGGLPATQSLRELDPDVKVIVASGYSNDPVVSNFKQHGFCAQLDKPFLLNELTQVLEEATKS